MSTPRVTRSTLAAMILLAATARLGAQAPASAGAAPPRVLTPAAQPAQVRDPARQHAEQMRLMARMEMLATRLDAGSDLDPAERRRVEAELEQVFTQLTELHAHAGLDAGTRIILRREPGAAGDMRRLLGEAERRVQSASRTGYVGITLSPTGNHVQLKSGGEIFVRYLDYPSIMTVEPSSPAEQAGLQRGDVVLAYDDMDVRGEVPMHEILAPGRPLRIRVRRDGRERTVNLTVAAPPAVVRDRREEFLLPSRREVPRDGFDVVLRRPLREPEARSVVVFARGIAGAELSPITEGLGAALGVKEGLLVLSVATRSPAALAGLRDGDVIVKAGGEVVESIPALSRVVRAHAAERMVALELRRDRKTRTVHLRW